jgi:hypothetical protein
MKLIINAAKVLGWLALAIVSPAQAINLWTINQAMSDD